jgi:hypothetical protein
MIIKTRTSVTATGGAITKVFDTAPVPGFSTELPVPVKINVVGPFLNIDTYSTGIVTKMLRIGWNLVAPHTEDIAPFDVVFREATVVAQMSWASRAVTIERAVKAIALTSPNSIVANMIGRYAIATISDAINPSYSYWVYINEYKHPQSGAVKKPVITPSQSENTPD